MKPFHIILGILIIIGALILFVQRVEEGFEGEGGSGDPEEERLTKAIETILTPIQEILCPVQNTVLDNEKGDLKGPDSERMPIAARKILIQVKGTILPCPVPTDYVELPANLGARLQRMVAQQSIKLPELKMKIINALNDCSGKKEGFEDMASTQPPLVCTKFPGEEPMPLDILKTDDPEQYAKVEAAQRAKQPPPPKPACTKASDLTQAQRNLILTARLQNLQSIAADEEFQKQLVTVKVMADELRKIRSDAEKGDLKPNC